MEALRHFWPPHMIHPHLDVMQQVFGDEEVIILKNNCQTTNHTDLGMWTRCGQDVDD